ncbi:hypothetical protein IWQ61_001422 [Dispira simplex]|nr:hypothetical protein IWQ61_001422 [Dispira simplex]
MYTFYQIAFFTFLAFTVADSPSKSLNSSECRTLRVDCVKLFPYATEQLAAFKNCLDSCMSSDEESFSESRKENPEETSRRLKTFASKLPQQDDGLEFDGEEPDIDREMAKTAKNNTHLYRDKCVSECVSEFLVSVKEVYGVSQDEKESATASSTNGPPSSLATENGTLTDFLQQTPTVHTGSTATMIMLKTWVLVVAGMTTWLSIS